MPPLSSALHKLAGPEIHMCLKAKGMTTPLPGTQPPLFESWRCSLLTYHISQFHVIYLQMETPDVSLTSLFVPTNDIMTSDQLLKSLSAKTLRDQSAIELIQCQNTS